MQIPSPSRPCSASRAGFVLEPIAGDDVVDLKPRPGRNAALEDVVAQQLLQAAVPGFSLDGRPCLAAVADGPAPRDGRAHRHRPWTWLIGLGMLPPFDTCCTGVPIAAFGTGFTRSGPDWVFCVDRSHTIWNQLCAECDRPMRNWPEVGEWTGRDDGVVAPGAADRSDQSPGWLMRASTPRKSRQTSGDFSHRDAVQRGWDLRLVSERICRFRHTIPASIATSSVRWSRRRIKRHQVHRPLRPVQGDARGVRGASRLVLRQQGRGEPFEYNGTYQACVNGDWYQVQAPKLLEESARSLRDRRLVFNMFGYLTTDYSFHHYGLCHCENCQP